MVFEMCNCVVPCCVEFKDIFREFKIGIGRSCAECCRSSRQLGCKVAMLPLKYLGLLLGTTLNQKVVWNFVVKRMEKQLAGWKRMYFLREAESL